MRHARHYLNWLFKDMNGRNGKYVIVEAPNAPLLVFMVSIILAIAIYPGPLQKALVILAYLALTIWGFLEMRSGRSRFRRMLGGAGLLAVLGAIVLGLGLR